MTRAAIWTFVVPRPSSTTPSDKVAQVLSKLLKEPIVWNDKWNGKWPAKKTELLFIVNGSYSYCKDLPAVAPAIRNAKRVIWIMNDYAVIPPKSASEAETPFRAAFRERREKGLPETEFWTTVKEYVRTKNDHYINWNALAYTPLDLGAPKRGNGKAIYYGYYRMYRQAAFDTYFKKNRELIDLWSPSKKFAELYPKMQVIPKERLINGVSWEDWLRKIREYSAGLYLEDSKSTASYHSPATRFYEMLSAGVPIAFDARCHGTFKTYAKRSGYAIDIEPYLVSSRNELREFIGHHKEFAKAQQRWHFDYYDDVLKKVKRLLREVT